MLQERKPYMNNDKERLEWENWKKAAPLTNPLDEPRFNMEPVMANNDVNFFPGESSRETPVRIVL